MTEKIINDSSYGVVLKSRPSKGRMAWEYNPFKNLRLESNKYVYNGKWYTEKELADIQGIYRHYTYNNTTGVGYEDFKQKLEELYDGVNYPSDLDMNHLDLYSDYFCKPEAPLEQLDVEVHEKYELVDFDTSDLGFDLENPVEMLPQYSYDGSVNLILNDGKNIPRLINSRFSVLDSNSYEIVDRKGDNDTNIYDEGEQFDIDTSLYKRVNNILKIEFNGVQAGGNMRVGNYHFYFKLADADGNESDFIGLSGLVSLFKGYTDPHSVHTGTKNQNCHKMVNFLITNIDLAYSYVMVYYSRTSAEGVENIVVDCLKINKKFVINSGKCVVLITGFEDTTEITQDDLNWSYNIIDSAKTQALNGNRLFLGNVHKADIPYKELEDLSLRFIPECSTEPYGLSGNKMSQSYTINGKDPGYYNVQNIYNKVGYWPGEYYRFGIVYILKSGELSPVFNIRGGLNIRENESLFSSAPLTINGNRNYITYKEDTYIIDNTTGGNVLHENAKGVVSYNIDNDLTDILHIHIKILDTDNSSAAETLELIRKHAKGFFFVRQKRIPTILAQGITIGIDSESRTPVIPTQGGVLDYVIGTLGETSHVVYEKNPDDNGEYTLQTHYVTEGFLTRYKMKFEKKKAKLGSKILKIGGIIVGAVVLAAASILTFGGAAAVTSIVGGIVAGTLAGAALVTAVACAAAFALTTALGFAVLGMMNARNRRQWKKNPLIYNGWNTVPKAGQKLVEDNDSRKLGGSFKDRLIIKRPEYVEVKGIICPDYALNQPYYNSIFTGNEHLIAETNLLPNTEYFKNNRDRHFYVIDYDKNDYQDAYSGKIVGLRDNVKMVGIGSHKFRARAGEAEQCWQYENVGTEYDIPDINDGDGGKIYPKQINSDIVRGSFGPYLATDTEMYPCRVVNIYIPGYSENSYMEYMGIRAEDKSPFYQISDRIDIQPLNNEGFINAVEQSTEWDIYRGDSYLCQYTHRLIRNFNDPSAPLNDKIVAENCWKDNYNPDDKASFDKINLGDVNAVKLGMWVTFRLRSSYNLNIRTVDESNVDETALSGHGRGYYPYYGMNVDGNYKNADSQVYNKGFSIASGHQTHFEQPDVPSIKNWFGTRIMYSDIHITDAFRNGYRVFQPTNYRDYTREYGQITKLVSYGNDLICVMEHGILSLKVNASAINNTHINVNNVLPETPIVLSSDFGSLWKDSIIKTDRGIYGIDTVAKKIWRILNNQVLLLSEGVVQEFLNRNIKLKERDTNVVLGRRNVKTLYNKFKYDVMFTFYNLTEFDEIAWNLCFNEKLDKFITFYSWIPSFMENIDNIPFSFNRETSRYLSIINQKNNLIKVYNYDGDETCIIDDINKTLLFIVKLDSLYIKPDSIVTYKLCQSKNKYNLNFTEWTHEEDSDYVPVNAMGLDFTNDHDIPLWKLLEDANDLIVSLNIEATVQDDTVIRTYKQIIYLTSKDNFNNWTTDFWKHGQAGIIDILDDIKPTNWYNEQHPFEFEFVVCNDVHLHKIFDDLEIISNSAEPESFHYEIVGDAYDFAKDKKNMFIRQEATDHLYYTNGADVMFDSEYLKIEQSDPPVLRPLLDDSGNEVPGYYDKSTLLPLHYYHQDYRGVVYDWYLQQHVDESYVHDYSHLAGGEIKYYKGTNEYHIVNHAQGVDLKGRGGRLRGNMHYREDTWKVLINPLNLVLCNEDKWPNGKIPYELTFGDLPDAIKNKTHLEIPDTDTDRQNVVWENYNYSEAKLKDKWIKIRIRYKGDKLAVITAIRTLYSISYS